MQYTYNKDNDRTVIGYELWALGYDKQGNITDMEVQFCERAETQDTLDDLLKQAEAATATDLLLKCSDQITKNKVTVVYLQVEELHDYGDDDICSDPIYERAIEVEVK